MWWVIYRGNFAGQNPAAVPALPAGKNSGLSGKQTANDMSTRHSTHLIRTKYYRL